MSDKETLGKTNAILAPSQPIEKGLFDPEIPHLYANQIFVGMGNCDVSIVLAQNGRPVGTLNLSFNLAKTLNNLLSELVEKLEEKSGVRFLTTMELDRLLREAMVEEGQSDE